MRMKLLIVSALIWIFEINVFAQTSTQSLHQKSISAQSASDWVQHYFSSVGFDAKPAPSVDVQMLFQHIKQHPNRWNTVRHFLTQNDLLTIPLGKKILNDNVTANVQEYTTRDPGEQHLEAHRKYIDFQYVIIGKELMGSGKLSEAKVVNPYDSTKDVGHYALPSFPYYVATPQYFFVFFPSQVHLTNIQFGDKALVRKIVFKIKFK